MSPEERAAHRRDRAGDARGRRPLPERNAPPPRPSTHGSSHMTRSSSQGPASSARTSRPGAAGNTRCTADRGGHRRSSCRPAHVRHALAVLAVDVVRMGCLVHMHFAARVENVKLLVALRAVHGSGIVIEERSRPSTTSSAPSGVWGQSSACPAGSLLSPPGSPERSTSSAGVGCGTRWRGRWCSEAR